jgi:hypothetical protein
LNDVSGIKNPLDQKGTIIIANFGSNFPDSVQENLKCEEYNGLKEKDD